jgi:hypothetical protein
MPHTERTLRALLAAGLRVHLLDAGSTDGSREIARSLGVALLLAPSSDAPGRLLNRGMQATTSPVVLFVDADAIPLDRASAWLLVEACFTGAAAAFGRQLARPTATATTRLDHERAFPPEGQTPPIADFFSIIASAVRRDVWARLPFDEELPSSEDLDWAYRVRALGLEIRYVPAACFEHSQDDERSTLHRRMRGEGFAAASVFRRGRPSVARDLLLPLGAQIARDAGAGALSPAALVRRTTAAIARFEGRRAASEVASVSPRDVPFQTGTPRFTLGEEPGAERAAHEAIERAAEVAWSHLGEDAIALLLVGSFGAGEGVVERRGGAARVHNALDLVLVVSHPLQARLRRPDCARVAALASAAAGTQVTLWPAPRGELDNHAGKLLWVDAAVRGVRVLRGDPGVLDPLARLAPRAAAGDELGRLLGNRAAGLALSRLSFAAGDDEGARAARHLAKARLAAGDALLLLVDAYPSRIRRRLAALRALAAPDAPLAVRIADGYALALEHRVAGAPGGVSAAELERACDELFPVFNDLEARRLSEPAAASPAGYAFSATRRFVELRDVPTASRLLGGARAAASGVIRWSAALTHPRETLARAAILLAFEPDLARACDLAGRLLCLRDPSPRVVRECLLRLVEAAA